MVIRMSLTVLNYRARDQIQWKRKNPLLSFWLHAVCYNFDIFNDFFMFLRTMYFVAVQRHMNSYCMIDKNYQIEERNDAEASLMLH